MFYANETMEWAVSWKLCTKDNTISISDIVSALVTIYPYWSNQQITNAKKELVGISEAVRPRTIKNKKKKEKAWNQWLAGVIDSDGSL